MTRSYRKPYHVLSTKIDKDFDHKKVRKRVKQELLKDEPDLCIIEGDTKELGLQEWGTKFGYEFLGDLSEEERVEYIEDRMKACRK